MKFNNTNYDKAVWWKYYEDRPKWRKYQGDQNVVYEFMKAHQLR